MTGIDGGNRAKMQVTGAFWPFGWERPSAVVGCRIDVERIARSGLGGAAHDEGEHCRARVTGDVAKIDAVFSQGGRKRLAVAVRGKSGNKSRWRAKPAQPDCDIVGRAAEKGVVNAQFDGIGNEIDQRLTGDQDHLT